MASVENAPFLLARRSDPPVAVRRHRGGLRLRLCQTVFGLAMLGVCGLLAYEVKEAKETGVTVTALLPLR
jgi:hypothetical protein